MQQFIIIPITNIQALCSKTPELISIFSKLSLKAIIEIILNLETSKDLSLAIWDEVEERFTQDEIETLDLNNLDFLFEDIISTLYNDLQEYTGQMDNYYKVHYWLPDSACLTFRTENDRPQVPVHYLYSQYKCSPF